MTSLSRREVVWVAHTYSWHHWNSGSVDTQYSLALNILCIGSVVRFNTHYVDQSVLYKYLWRICMSVLAQLCSRSIWLQFEPVHSQASIFCDDSFPTAYLKTMNGLSEIRSMTFGGPEQLDDLFCSFNLVILITQFRIKLLACWGWRISLLVLRLSLVLTGQDYRENFTSQQSCAGLGESELSIYWTAY